jgi:hypothetical protein
MILQCEEAALTSWGATVRDLVGLYAVREALSLTMRLVRRTEYRAGRDARL